MLIILIINYEHKEQENGFSIVDLLIYPNCIYLNFIHV